MRRNPLQPVSDSISYDRERFRGSGVNSGNGGEGGIYEGQMIPNSIGYDPAGFSAADPLREERTGRRSYHSGRHRGTDGSIIKDSRQTTRALLKPRGAPASGTTSNSPSSAQRQSDAIGRGEMVPSLAYGDAKPGEAVYPAQVRNQAIAAQNVANRQPTQPAAKPVAKPLAPRGMVPSMVEAPGPYAPGMAPQVPGFRPAARKIDGVPLPARKVPTGGLIDGKPAAQAIAEAEQSATASTSNPTAGPEQYLADARARVAGMNPQQLDAAIKENLARPQLAAQANMEAAKVSAPAGPSALNPDGTKVEIQVSPKRAATVAARPPVASRGAPRTPLQPMGAPMLPEANKPIAPANPVRRTSGAMQTGPIVASTPAQQTAAPPPNPFKRVVNAPMGTPEFRDAAWDATKVAAKETGKAAWNISSAPIKAIAAAPGAVANAFDKRKRNY